MVWLAAMAALQLANIVPSSDDKGLDLIWRCFWGDVAFSEVRPPGYMLPLSKHSQLLCASVNDERHIETLNIKY